MSTFLSRLNSNWWEGDDRHLRERLGEFDAPFEAASKQRAPLQRVEHPNAQYKALSNQSTSDELAETRSSERTSSSESTRDVDAQSSSESAARDDGSLFASKENSGESSMSQTREQARSNGAVYVAPEAAKRGAFDAVRQWQEEKESNASPPKGKARSPPDNALANKSVEADAVSLSSSSEVVDTIDMLVFVAGTIGRASVTVSLSSDHDYDAFVSLVRTAVRQQHPFCLQTVDAWEVFAVDPSSGEAIGCLADVTLTPYETQQQLVRENVRHEFELRPDDGGVPDEPDPREVEATMAGAALAKAFARALRAFAAVDDSMRGHSALKRLFTDMHKATAAAVQLPADDLDAGPKEMVIKCKYGAESRHFTLLSTANLMHLNAAIHLAFQWADTYPLRIFYLDSDDDLIRITDDNSLREAFQCAYRQKSATVRINVELAAHAHKSPPSSNESSPSKAGPAKKSPSKPSPSKAKEKKTKSKSSPLRKNETSDADSNDAEVPKAAAEHKPMMVALYEYEATESNEIDLKVGDLIEVIEMGDEDGWTNGTVQSSGKSGLFPTAFAKLVPIGTGGSAQGSGSDEESSLVEEDESEKAHESQSANEHESVGESAESGESAASSSGLFGDEHEQEAEVTHTVRATHKYRATENDELSFRKGDLIEVTEADADWWHGTLKSTGAQGLVPKGFVKIVQ